MIRARVVVMLLAATSVFVATSSALGASPSPSTAPGPTRTITVTPSLATARAEAGGSTSVELTLIAGEPLDITIENTGLGQATDGTFVYLSPADDTGPFSARSMLRLEPAAMKLAAGETRTVEIRATVPAGTADSVRYAFLKVNATRPASGGNVGVNAVIGVPFVLTIGNPVDTLSGVLTDLSANTVSLGGPLAVHSTLTNTGSTRYGAPPRQLYLAAILIDPKGAVVARTRVTPDGNSLLPGLARDAALQLDPEPPMGDGKYHLEMEAGLEDGTILDAKAVDLVAVRGGVLGTSESQIEVYRDNWTTVILALVLGLLAGALAVVVTILVNRRRRALVAANADRGSGA